MKRTARRVTWRMMPKSSGGAEGTRTDQDKGQRAMSTSERFTIVFEYERETKNTYKYSEKPEAGQPPRIGSLYVQKWALGSGDPPRQLAVTVAAVSGTRE